MNTPHYLPTRDGDGTWQFTTPMGMSTGFFSEPEAKRAAARTEAVDRTCALHDKGPLAKVLRPHFFPEASTPTKD
jgi:hypothetical protein